MGMVGDLPRSCLISQWRSGLPSLVADGQHPGIGIVRIELPFAPFVPLGTRQREKKNHRGRIRDFVT